VTKVTEETKKKLGIAFAKEVLHLQMILTELGKELDPEIWFFATFGASLYCLLSKLSVDKEKFMKLAGDGYDAMLKDVKLCDVQGVGDEYSSVH